MFVATMSLTFPFPFVVDSILERGTGTMPREIFQCPNVKSLSLKNNFLEWLHPEVGKALERDVYQNSVYSFLFLITLRLPVLSWWGYTVLVVWRSYTGFLSSVFNAGKGLGCLPGTVQLEDTAPSSRASHLDTAPVRHITVRYCRLLNLFFFLHSLAYQMYALPYQVRTFSEEIKMQRGSLCYYQSSFFKYYDTVPGYLLHIVFFTVYHRTVEKIKF
jgi:hypothetical protein